VFTTIGAQRDNFAILLLRKLHTITIGIIRLKVQINALDIQEICLSSGDHGR
jgi:hypothetical protein